jgi:microcystin-dependent protein
MGGLLAKAEAYVDANVFGNSATANVTGNVGMQREAISHNVGVQREAISHNVGVEKEAISNNVGLQSQAISNNVGVEKEAISNNVGLQSQAISNNVGVEKKAISNNVGLQSQAISNNVGVQKEAISNNVGMEKGAITSTVKINFGGFMVLLVTILPQLLNTFRDFFQTDISWIQVTANSVSAFGLTVLFSIGLLLLCTFINRIKKLEQQIIDSANSHERPVTSVPTGTVIAYAGEYVPSGWVICDGSDIPRSDEYNNLSSVLGSSILPDLRSKFILGVGGGYNLHQKGGEEAHLLTPNEMPKHTHEVIDHGHSHGIRKSANSSQQPLIETLNGSWSSPSVNSGIYPHEIISTSRSGITLGNSGNNIAHNNMPPYYVMLYIIKL